MAHDALSSGIEFLLRLRHNKPVYHMRSLLHRAPEPSKREVESFFIEELEFDLRNPRYGAGAARINTEREALDHIVSMFGVTDVLSSLAVNGFFDSEPLVGIRLPGESKIKILEGNRRLAACLILAGDQRAEGQAKLKAHYEGLYASHGKKCVSPIPVLVYDDLKEVLPYIGVRHIVGFLEWDSFAKAAWVDNVLKTHGLQLSEVQEMVGDKNDTIPRMLAGYRFVNQVVREGFFRPDQSQRKGRGSNPDFPFSWVYTALDNPPIKSFVDFQEKGKLADENPVPEDKLEDAGILLTFMFGDKHRGMAAVVEDSRDLGDLAKAIREPVLRNRLKEGKKLRLVIEEARPSVERLAEGLQRVADQLKDMTGLIVPGSLEPTSALQLVEPARQVTNLSRKVYNDLRSVVVDNPDTEEPV